MPWEIRWYHQGKIPSNVNIWFDNLKKVSFVDRVDYYFPKKKYDFVGVKIRGDSKKKLECKWLLDTQNFISSNRKVSGILERWEKWSWNEDPALISNYAKLTDNASSIVKIDKKRKQIKFEKRSNVMIKTVERVGEDKKGIGMELTALIAKKQNWWSLAIELISKDWNKKQDLKNAVNFLLKDYLGPALESNKSYGYPKWITML